jgi:hypothetical protein
VAYAQPEAPMEQRGTSVVFDVEEVVPWQQIRMVQQQRQGLKISFTVSFPPSSMQPVANLGRNIDMQLQLPDVMQLCLQEPEPTQLITIVPNAETRKESRTVEGSDESQGATTEAGFTSPTLAQQARAVQPRPISAEAVQTAAISQIPELQEAASAAAPSQATTTPPTRNVRRSKDKRVETVTMSMASQKIVSPPTMARKPSAATARPNSPMFTKELTRKLSKSAQAQASTKAPPVSRKQLFPKHSPSFKAENKEKSRRAIRMLETKLVTTSPTSTLVSPAPKNYPSSTKVKETRLACSSAPRISRAILRAPVIRPERSKVLVTQILLDSLGRLSSPCKTYDTSLQVSKKVESANNKGKTPIPRRLFEILSPLAPTTPPKREIKALTGQCPASVTPTPPRQTTRSMAQKSEVRARSMAKGSTVQHLEVALTTRVLISGSLANSGSLSDIDANACKKSIGAESKTRTLTSPVTTTTDYSPASQVPRHGSLPVSSRPIRKRSLLGYKILNRKRSKIAVVKQKKGLLVTQTMLHTSARTARERKRSNGNLAISEKGMRKNENLSTKISNRFQTVLKQASQVVGDAPCKSIQTKVVRGGKRSPMKKTSTVAFEHLDSFGRPKKVQDQQSKEKMIAFNFDSKKRAMQRALVQVSKDVEVDCLNENPKRSTRTKVMIRATMPDRLSQLQQKKEQISTLNSLSATAQVHKSAKSLEKKRAISQTPQEGYQSPLEAPMLRQESIVLLMEEKMEASPNFRDQSHKSDPATTARARRQRRWSVPHCSLGSLEFTKKAATASIQSGLATSPEPASRSLSMVKEIKGFSSPPSPVQSPRGSKRATTHLESLIRLTQERGPYFTKKRMSCPANKDSDSEVSIKRRRQRQYRTCEPTDSIAMLSNAASMTRGCSIPNSLDSFGDEANDSDNFSANSCEDDEISRPPAGRLGFHLAYMFAQTGIEDKFKKTTEFQHPEYPFPLDSKGMAMTPLPRVLKNQLKKRTLDKYLYDKFGKDNNKNKNKNGVDDMDERTRRALQRSNQRKITEYERRIRVWEFLRED